MPEARQQRDETHALRERIQELEALLASGAGSTPEGKQRHSRLFALIREGVAHYRAIYDESGTITDLTILDINLAGARLSGRPASEQIGKTWRELWPDVDPSLFALYRQAEATGADVRFDHDNHITGRTYDVAISPVAPAEFIVTFNDVTDRKAAGDDLRHAAELIELGDGFIELDREWRIIGVNAAQERISRMSRSQTLGRVVWEIWPEMAEPDSSYWREYQRCMTERVRVQFDEYFAPLDLWTAVTAYPTSRGIAAFFRDVTVEKRAQQALASRERDLARAQAAASDAHERLRRVLDSITDGMLVLDREWRYTYFSENGARLIGMRADDLLGGCVWDLFPHAKGTKFYEGYHRAVETGERVDFEEYYPEPLNRWLECHCYPSAEGLTVYFHDVTERRRVEDALRESEERYRFMVNASPVGFLLGDVHGGIADANDTLLGMIGYSRADLGHLRWDLITPPEWLPVDQARMDEARQRGVCTPYEKEYFHRDGRRVPILVGYALLGEERRRSAAFIVDLTDLKKVQRELTASEARLRLAQDTAGFGTWEWDLETGITRFSDACLALHGIQRTNTFGYADWLACVHDDDRSRIDRSVCDAVAQGTSYDEEFRVVWADGSIHWLNGRGHVVASPSGSAATFTCVSFDITGRKRMEDALRQSESSLRQLTEAVPDIVWTATGAGMVDYFNSRWYSYTGQAEGEAKAAGWCSAVHPEDLDRALTGWKQAIVSATDFEGEFRLSGSGGTYRWFLARARALCDTSGQVTKWFGTFSDIDEQKRTEQALRRSNEDLQQFAHIASHDLQEPLRTIGSLTTLLGRKYGGQMGADADQYVQWIVAAANRMSQLIRDILAYTAATSEQGRVVKPCDGNHAFAVASEQLQELARSRQAQITSEPLPVVYADPGQLVIVFRHLLSNGLKYAQDGVSPRIHVTARRDASEWQFCVTDNGIGFDPQYSERIFGIFKRLHGTEVPGTGIGLAICKTIVERHGGRMWAESVEGRGSAFFFTLPDSVHGGANGPRG